MLDHAHADSEVIQVFDGTGPIYATVEQWDNLIRNYVEALDAVKAASLVAGMVYILGSKIELLLANTFVCGSDLRIFKLRAEQRELLISDIIFRMSKLASPDYQTIVSKLEICRSVCHYAQRAELP